MIMTSDKEYKATKQIMLGNKNVKDEFKPLMEWIDKTFQVKTINLYYDTIDKGTRPRLGVYFETSNESSSFHENGEFTNYDSKKQKHIAKKFKHFMKEQNLLKNDSFFNFFSNKKTGVYSAENIWIYTSAFEPIAKIEANESIPEDKVRKLRDELCNKDLWGISRGFSETTFFLYTNQQVKEYENSEARKLWAEKYFDLLEPYNEFGYFKREQFNIHIDSKENFDDNYESNWFYYYK